MFFQHVAFFRQAVWAVIGSVIFVNATLRAETPPPVQAPTIEQAPVPVPTPTLKKQSLGNLRPVQALGDIYLAGQPTPADLPLLKQHGIKTIITLRKTDEVPWDEAAAVKQLGMKFVQVPFQQPAELKPKVFDEVLKVLRDKKRGPTVLHCGSANRVGAIWYAHRVLDGKLSTAAALKEAQVVGLRTPGYLEQARAYVKQVQQDKQKAAVEKNAN